MDRLLARRDLPKTRTNVHTLPPAVGIGEIPINFEEDAMRVRAAGSGNWLRMLQEGPVATSRRHGLDQTGVVVFDLSQGAL
jgi:hypothetical protein